MIEVILGIYGSDLHKLICNLIAENFSFILDIIFAALCFLVFLLALFKKNTPKRFFNIPVLMQILLLALLSISLIHSHDEVSLFNYIRFLGGNILLFFSALVICRKEKQVKKIWNIWIITSVILAAISVWFFFQGITWQSGQAAIIEGTGIRTGYFCAIGLIYLFVSSNLKIKYFLIPLFLFAVIVSASKGALLLLIGTLFFVLPLIQVINKKLKLKTFISLIFVILIFLGLLIFILPKTGEGEVKEVAIWGNYVHSLSDRLDLTGEYIKLGLSHPIIGNGISASYSLIERTHSVILSLFVQIGIFGILFYLIFALNMFFIGFKLLKKTKNYNLALATFLIVLFTFLQGEITLDVPGNRIFWFFSGILLALYQNAD